MNDPTSLQLAILRTGTCHIDGWTSPRVRDAIAGLLKMEYIKFVSEGGSDEQQYTSFNYRVTDKGRQAFIIHDTPSAT